MAITRYMKHKDSNGNIKHLLLLNGRTVAVKKVGDMISYTKTDPSKMGWETIHAHEVQEVNKFITSDFATGIGLNEIWEKDIRTGKFRLKSVI